MKHCFWTTSGARLSCKKLDESSSLNWVFLPGGPGLGSESLAQLTSQQLQVPGNFWHLDLPGDGSNTLFNGFFQNWSSALIEAVQAFDSIILVAHSTGGMYALFTPELEPLIEGLILLDTAPDAKWQIAFAEEIKKHPLPKLEVLQKTYRNHPSNDTLKALTLGSAPYLFTSKGLKKGIAMLKSLPYNWEAVHWSEKYFDSIYLAKWIPQVIPTLILAGQCDLITPLELFTQAKKFHRDNIVIQLIHNSGHFPWIENPGEVNAAFQAYYKKFQNR